MEKNKVYEQLNNHIRQFFTGHRIIETTFDKGPILTLLPNFRVLCIAPGPKVGLWVYVSTGVWEITIGKNEHIEFLLMSPKPAIRCVELLAMSAYYHYTEGLGLNHTYPIGKPWLGNSLSDHFLISLPYTFGPQLELCSIGDENIHIYWLLPITKKEKDFKAENGLEALESKFEEKGIQYWLLDRPSVI
ncbi:MAG: suppressor of fused domain protein [Blastocatellales bacterium]